MSKKVLIVVLFLYGIVDMVAGPPAPIPPPPPDASIDHDLIILLGGALFLGIYSMRRYILKQKVSI